MATTSFWSNLKNLPCKPASEPVQCTTTNFNCNGCLHPKGPTEWVSMGHCHWRHETVERCRTCPRVCLGWPSRGIWHACGPHLPPALHHKLWPQNVPYFIDQMFLQQSWNYHYADWHAEQHNCASKWFYDHDVYMEILDITTWCFPITLVFLHVKSHQDTNKHCPLTVMEQLNVDCDWAAKNMSHPPYN